MNTTALKFDPIAKKLADMKKKSGPGQPPVSGDRWPTHRAKARAAARRKAEPVPEVETDNA
ncbi:hypothetical protein [Williamsia sp. 1135]|uniref:hypothetical protein n=1 Tax=Williamsia sp. 1135 TaxID=1889262 RepID=UPI000A112385|nr:hypothetical protein [Williamsia sp. 1135]ORM37955.1 hypothetical protein BFL43_02150 [Williamsia sp. 1135]